MRMNKIILIFFGLILLSGCSNFNVNDGVIRDEQGASILGVYGELPIETHAQHSLFEGREYILGGRFTINAGASNYFLGCTGNKAVHFEDFYLTLSSTPFDVNFYESPTLTSNGTQVYGKTTERNFNDTHDLLVYINPTFTANGTFLFAVSDYGSKQITGELAFPSEMILRINTCYLFEITNNDGNNVEVTYNFIWHESEYNYTEYFN